MATKRGRISTRPRVVAGLLAAPLLVVGVWAGHVAAAAPSASATTLASCDAADARLTGHQLEAARALYAQALAVAPGLPCAVQGLDTVLAQRTHALDLLEQGRDALARGDRASARLAFAQALAIDSDLTEAAAGLDAVDASPAPRQDAFSAAEALLKAGFVDEAEAAAKAALKANPSATLPPDLVNLPGQAGPIARTANGWDLWREWAAAAGDIFTAPILIGGICLLALGLVLRRRFFLAKRLEIGNFDDTASTGHEGPGLAGLIRAEIARLAAEGDGPSIRVAAGIDAALTLPAPVVSASTTAGLVAALAGLVGPPSHQLTGEIGADAGIFGRRLTLALKRSNGAADAVDISVAEYSGLLNSASPAAGPVPKKQESAAMQSTSVARTVRRAIVRGDRSPGARATTREQSTTETFSAVPPATNPQPPLAESLELAALAAAVWVAYQMVPPGDRVRLPTLDWRSFALTRAGAELHRAGQRDRAERLTQQALALDRQNRIALANLGAFYQNTNPKDAVALLALALELHSSAEKQPALGGAIPVHDRLWYRIKYNLAAASYMQHFCQLPNATLPDDFKEPVIEVAKSAVDRRAKLPSNAEANVEERAFLYDILLAALVLLALVRREGRANPVKATRSTSHRDEAWLQSNIDHLGDRQIIEWVDPHSADVPLPPRVHYNLACYWATDSRSSLSDRGRAWRHLAQAVRDGHYAVQAEADPMLQKLIQNNLKAWERLKAGTKQPA
jgi:tetratricopeptide (TPR) repeat protein